MAEACVSVPVAVGYEPSQVSASDFPGSFGSYFCPGDALYSAIVGFFILTSGNSPSGYVTAYYDIQNGAVGVSYQATVTYSCSTTSTSG